MYKIYFTKQALNDLDKLKSAGLSGKAKVLLDVVRENPYQCEDYSNVDAL